MAAKENKSEPKQKKLKKGKAYYFRIRNVNGNLHSQWSSLKSVTVK